MRSQNRVSRGPHTGIALSGLAVLALTATSGCGGMRPYRAMAKAASSEESAFSQASDDRLKIRVRESLVTAGLIHVTPYVYMGHVYLVGHVDSPQQADQAVAAVRAMSGVRSVDTYLPPTQAGGGASGMASDVEIEAKVKSALAVSGDEVMMRIDMQVVYGTVVLLGVVANQQAIDTAVSRAQSVSGVTGVTNFLLLPEQGYERLRPGLR